MKQLLKYVISMVLVIGVFTPFTLTNVRAANVYELPINEPQFVDGDGYIIILLKNNSTGEKGLHVYQWFTQKSNQDVSISNPTYFDVLLNDDSLKFYLGSNTGITRATIIRWTNTTVQVHNLNTANNTGTGINDTTKEFTFTNYTICGYQIHGSVGQVYEYLSNKEVFGVSWNNGDNTSTDISEMVEQLTQTNEYLLDISGSFDEVLNYLKTISDDIKTNNTLLGNIITKLEELILAVLQTDKSDTVKDNIDNVKDEFDNVSNEYNEIESNLTNDFVENMGNIKLENNLFKGNDFIKSSNFIATQMSNIYEINPNVKNMITYSMIIGLALTVIGIKLGR